jgi:hypothetical protein
MERAVEQLNRAAAGVPTYGLCLSAFALAGDVTF